MKKAVFCVVSTLLAAYSTQYLTPGSGSIYNTSFINSTLAGPLNGAGKLAREEFTMRSRGFTIKEVNGIVTPPKGEQTLAPENVEVYLRTEEGQTALKLFEHMLKNDPDAFGFLRDEGVLGSHIEGGRFAAMDENIKIINAAFAKIFGTREDGVMLLNAIGGQSTTSQWFGTTPRSAKRKYFCLDSLGTNYKKLEDQLVALLQADPSYPVMWLASSKSGTTDETMANFQSTFKMLIRVYARNLGSRELGNKIVQAMFNAQDPCPIWEVTMERVTKEMTEAEAVLAKEVIKKVLGCMVYTTDHNIKETAQGKKFASRLTAFRYGKLVEEVLGGPDNIPSMHIPRDLGGRYNGIGANALTIAKFMGLDIEKIAVSSRAMLRTLRSESYAGTGSNPLTVPAAQIALAARCLKQNGGKVLVAVNDEELASAAEALGQLFPETVGKGAAIGRPQGLYPVARVGQKAAEECMADMHGKVVIVINAKQDSNKKTLSPIRIENDKDLIITIDLADTTEASIAQLIPVLEYWAMMVSIFHEAQALTEIRSRFRGFDIAEMMREAVANAPAGYDKKDEDMYQEILRRIFAHQDDTLAIDEAKMKILLHYVHQKMSGALQGGVQMAKKLAQAAGPRMFNAAGTMVKKPGISDQLAVRSAGERKAWYAARAQKGVGFDPAAINIGSENFGARVERITASASLAPLEDAQEQAAAASLAALMDFAAKNDKLLVLWGYTQSSEAFDTLKAFAERSGIHLLSLAPQIQHKSAQESVEGRSEDKLIVTVGFSRSLESVEASEDPLVCEMLVPSYLDGLTPSEVAALYQDQYDTVFKTLSEQGWPVFSASLLLKDIEVPANLEQAKRIIAKAYEIAQAARRQAAHGIPTSA